MALNKPGSIQHSLSGIKLLPFEEKLAVMGKQKSFTIGIPCEVEQNENRIALTPLSVELLVNNGHQVIIQSNAGRAANFFDHHFSECGAQISTRKEEVFGADIILKIAPPTETETELLRGNQILISTLNPAMQGSVYFQKLTAKKITCIAFEFLKDENGSFPIVRSMSEIAGGTAILIAAEYLSNAHGGKGEMLGGITGVNPSEVVILGAGTAAEFAARAAIGMGALVKVFDSSLWKLKRLQNNLGRLIYTSVMQPAVLQNALKTADVLIGAVKMTARTQPFFVNEEMVKKMKKGSVIIDISIDQGGCVETSYPTTHLEPVYEKFGILHYCVPNIPSRVARTAAYALSNYFAPLLLDIGKAGSLHALVKANEGFRSGIYIYNGILTNYMMGQQFNLPSQDINLILGAF